MKLNLLVFLLLTWLISVGQEHYSTIDGQSFRVKIRY